MRIETKMLSAGKEAIAVAVRMLAKGGLVAFPTDTVYGVGAHAFQPKAVGRIYVAKIRPRAKAIPILLARAEDLSLVTEGITETAQLLAERFWPGGLTLVMPIIAWVPEVVPVLSPPRRWRPSSEVASSSSSTVGSVPAAPPPPCWI